MKKAWALCAAVVAAAAVLAACSGPEERKIRYLEKGQSYFAERNYEKARVEFRNALQIDPQDATARYNIGRVAEKLNDPREAVAQYRAAVDADPKLTQPRAALGRLLLLGGLPDKAMELAEPGLAQEPTNAQLLTVRGAAKAQLGDVPGAFEDAEAALKGAPDDEYAIALLASLYRQNARSDRAIEVVRAGLERLPESVDLHIVLAELELSHERRDEAQAQLQKVVELQPRELAHRFRLARFHLLGKDKDAAAAERVLRDAVKAVPESVEAKVALVDLIAAHTGVEEAQTELKAFAAQEDDGAKLQLALARFHEAHRQPDQAQAVYRAVIEREGVRPDGLVARNRLAALLFLKNQTDAGTQLIEEVLKENPRDNDALVLRGNLALSRGDAAAAIADLRAVLRDQPNAVTVMRALARAHLQNNEIALAEETLRAAAQSNPGERAVRLELAQLLTQAGRPEQARPILEQLSVEAPADMPTLEALFRVQAALRDVASAGTTAQTIKRVRPDLPLGFYLEGVLLESQQKWDAALAAYEHAIEMQPNAAEPLTALTRVELARKQPARALARLDKIALEQPDNVVARNLKGELLTARGEIDAAVASFDDAIAKAPGWWLPYRGLALAHAAAKRNDAAMRALERGLQQTGAAALGTDLAALYERAGRPDDAIRVYDEMVKREPGSVAASNNLAMLLVTYRTDRASLDRAQQLTGQLSNVDEPAVLNTRGWVKFKRGEFQESVQLLQQAVEKAPASPMMRYHLGMAQLRIGNRDAARENLEAAVQAGQAFHGIREAQAALEQIKRAG